MNKYLLIFFCLVVFTIQLKSQNDQIQNPPNAVLIENLTKNRFTLKLENNRLTGNGATFLFNEAKRSQFFLIGEIHGIADSPIFTAALFRDINSYGYRTYAAEIGPITMQYLENMAKHPASQKKFMDFNRINPFSLPFFSWQEETLLLETIHKATKDKKQSLWGLDQEFVLSPVFHFKRLLELASNKEEKTVANEFHEKARKDYQLIVTNRNPGLAFLFSAKAGDFDKLDAAFKSNKNREVKRILRELRESGEIYQKNSANQGYASNAQRAQLMKSHFMAYYNEALRKEKSPPRVLFKFGANHMKRGRNFTNVYDIGNLVSELASANNSASFHLLVIAASGTQNAYNPFLENTADKQKKINVAEAYSFVDVKPLLAVAEQKDWMVVDLRSLRPMVGGRRLGQLPKGFADLIWGYDAVLLIPEARAATLFGEDEPK